MTLSTEEIEAVRDLAARRADEMAVLHAASGAADPLRVGAPFLRDALTELLRRRASGPGDGPTPAKWPPCPSCGGEVGPIAAGSSVDPNAPGCYRCLSHWPEERWRVPEEKREPCGRASVGARSGVYVGGVCAFCDERYNAVPRGLLP